ncbi:MAG: hypothetical protein IT369_13915 [Candidatus Latescibacteria bacterium]|nr:hypothetical protein [Candidatus Latescibacterota bacterium]
MSEDLERSGLTLRSLILGIGMVLVVCLGAPYAIWVLGSSEITWSFFPIGVGFPFVCLILVNILVKTLRPAWALRPAELMTVMVMGLVTTGIPIFMVGFLLSIPTTPEYFTSAENQWDQFLIPHLPQWLIPSNKGLAMTWFFEGLPFGEPVPWRTLLDAWTMPLFWWISFVWSLYFACFAMVVLLRRQWVERERLAYPLMEVPQALMVPEGSTDRVPPILRNKVFWIGAGVPLFIALWNTIGFFFHFFPQIPWTYPVQVARGFPAIVINLYFPVIGFMYFANLNVSFSIWFFYVFTLVEEGIFNRFGLGLTATDADTFIWGLPSTSWQCWGAFMVMVLWGLWMARDHLREVWRKARNSAYPIDDSHEMLSYRAAVIGFILAVLYMLAWLCKAGMPLLVALMFLVFVLIAYLGITRLVVQAGVYYLTTPVVAESMTTATLGTSAIPSKGLAALGLCYSFFGDVQSIFMPAAANASKLQDSLRLSRRGLSLAIALAVLVGFAASITYIIVMAYDQGASNFSSWFFRVSGGAGLRSFEEAVAKIKTPLGPNLNKLTFFGAGGLGMVFLTFMQYRFPWWPLHPIGLAIAAVWMVRNQAAPIFIAWAAKNIIMRFGGIDLYRKATPFFVGLIVGHFLGVGISFILDMTFFPGNGHPILHG